MRLILTIIALYFHLVKSTDNDFEKQIEDYEQEALTIKGSDGQNIVLNSTQMSDHIKKIYK